MNLSVKYCEHKTGNRSSCANFAIYKSYLCKRGDVPIIDNVKTSFRCEDCKNKGTAGFKVIDSIPFDQSDKIQSVNNYLSSLVGKTIRSTVHTAKELVVKYIKDNGGVMCQQPITKAWKFVYFNQIIEI